MEKEMDCFFNTLTAVAKWVYGVLKIVFECVFMQMTQPNLYSCNQLNSMRIMHIKRTVWAWFDKFNDLFFKNTNRFRILNIIIELILNEDGWKKGFWKYSCLTLNKGMLQWFVVICVDKILGII